MGGSSTPSNRDPAVDSQRGLDVYLRNLPRLLSEEQSARDTYDPLRIQHELDLENQFDPNHRAIREQMSQNILQDIRSGYAAPEGLRREGQQAVRGAQAARGNVLGNAPANQEAVFGASQALDMYNRRLAQAGTYLGMPSVATPDRSAAYTVGGSAAGAQGVAFGQQAFQKPVGIIK